MVISPKLYTHVYDETGKKTTLVEPIPVLHGLALAWHEGTLHRLFW